MPHLRFLARPIPALLLSVACVLAGCSDLSFYDREHKPEPPKPVEMKGLTLHNYSDGLEAQRVHAVSARYFEDHLLMLVDDVETYFYDDQPSNCQNGRLLADRALIFLHDDIFTSPPRYQLGDIDFTSNVVYLSREGYRVETDAMRFHKRTKLLTSDDTTTRVMLTGSGVWQDNGAKGFLLDLDANEFTMFQQSAAVLQDEELDRVRSGVEGELASIKWVCGPGDKPAPGPGEVEAR